MTNHEKRMRAVIAREATVTLTCAAEDLQIEGNALASGNDEWDREQEQWIRDQLDGGNEWAWCCARVDVEWEGFKETEYLGACSYKSRADFIACGERETMASEATARLADRLVKQYGAISNALKGV